MGGGTSNIGVFRAGRAIDTACLNIGGHLIELEPGRDRITYIADPARAVLKECGFHLMVGERITLEQLKQVTELMAAALVEAVTKQSISALTRSLLMTRPLQFDYRIEHMIISGGVADYVYWDFNPISVQEVSIYGDIGPLLGKAIREKFHSAGITLLKPAETIRATVIGAGTHSVDISGSTIHVREGTLPLRNVAVIAPF